MFALPVSAQGVVRRLNQKNTECGVLFKTKGKYSFLYIPTSKKKAAEAALIFLLIKRLKRVDQRDGRLGVGFLVSGRYL